MPSKLAMSSIDRESEPTRTTMTVNDAATTPELQALADAIDDIILGPDVIAKLTSETVIQSAPQAPPSDKFAERGNRWQIKVQDTANNIFTHSIGTANNALLPSSTDDSLDLTQTQGLALKTAIEAAYRTKENRTVTLVSCKQISAKD